MDGEGRRTGGVRFKEGERGGWKGRGHLREARREEGGGFGMEWGLNDFGSAGVGKFYYTRRIK